MDDLGTSKQDKFFAELSAFTRVAHKHDQAAVMIPDESAPPHPETEAPRPLLRAANDNGGTAATPIDPRILIIARAVGRLIAREQIDRLQTANDSRSEDER